ncbi:MAG: LemA family protein [Erysipelotrichaceae bacterium]|nr:LemA family protein [Erysipelotrichaceae bacterium]
MGLFIIILVLAIIFYIISIYNRFVHVHNKIQEALSGIDVALAKRYAILTNLVEVVKGYVKHEQELLLKLVEMRNQLTMKERIETDDNYSVATTKLLALQESYPELKANEQFLELQRAIRDCEEHLAASRRMYNSNVSIYNDLVLSFPSNIVGQFMNAQTEEYFYAKSEEKEMVQIKM